MKKALLLICLCIGLLVPATAHAGPVTIATGEWPPWSGENLPGQGYVLQLVREAFAETGHTVKYEFYPWARALVVTVEGGVDASAYWYESEKVKKDCYYSDVLTRERIVFFRKKSTRLEGWNTLEDLCAYRIGATLGVTFTEEIVRLGAKGVLTVDLAKDNLTNFRKLVHGRIDLLPSPEVLGLKILRDNFPPDVRKGIVIDPKPVSQRTGHLIFPRKVPASKELLQDFNRGLKMLIRSGRYDELLHDFAAGKFE